MVPFAVLYGSLRVLSGFRVQSQGFRGSGFQASFKVWFSGSFWSSIGFHKGSLGAQAA